MSFKNCDIQTCIFVILETINQERIALMFVVSFSKI